MISTAGEGTRTVLPASGGYFKVTKASRSTRGRPLVPTTMSLTILVAEVDHVFCQATTRYLVELDAPEYAEQFQALRRILPG